MHTQLSSFAANSTRAAGCRRCVCTTTSFEHAPLLQSCRPDSGVKVRLAARNYASIVCSHQAPVCHSICLLLQRSLIANSLPTATQLRGLPQFCQSCCSRVAHQSLYVCHNQHVLSSLWLFLEGGIWRQATSIHSSSCIEFWTNRIFLEENMASTRAPCLETKAPGHKPRIGYCWWWSGWSCILRFQGWKL